MKLSNALKGLSSDVPQPAVCCCSSTIQFRVLIDRHLPVRIAQKAGRDNNVTSRIFFLCSFAFPSHLHVDSLDIPTLLYNNNSTSDIDSNYVLDLVRVLFLSVEDGIRDA